MPDLISTDEAAEQLRVTTKRVRTLALQGRIPGARRVLKGRRAVWKFATPVVVTPGKRGPKMPVERSLAAAG